MDMKIRFHYHGTFFTRNQKLLYRKGLVHVTDFVDSDELSKFELENFLKEGAGVVGVKELWYLVGGQCINDGLRQIKADADINEMVGSVREDQIAHVYVLLDGDVSPSSLLYGGDVVGVGLRRSPRKPPVSIPNPKPIPNPTPDHNRLPTQSSSTSHMKFSNPPNYDPGSTSEHSKKRQYEAEEVEGGVFAEEEGDCAQSDSEGDEIRFVDSAEEEDDLFGDVEDGDPAFGKELVEIVNRDFDFDQDASNFQHPDSDVAEESDGLRSPEGSDDDEGPNRRFPEFNHNLGFKPPIRLEEGMMFASNAIFRKAITQFSVERGGDFYFLHNDKKKVSVQCKKKCDCKWKHCRKTCGTKKCKTLKCSFKACARRMCEDGTFQLKSLTGKHTCGKQHLNARITSSYLAEKYIEHYRDDPRMKLRVFINTVLRDLNVKITYSQAMRTRMRAFLMLQGDAKEQFSRSCDYAETLLKWKVASSAFVLCHGPVEKPIFKRFYVCLDACKKGFIEGCRPIIGLDGCHLKGAYTGQILSAVAKDGNENIFPIAYAVVESECKDSWGWFMENLVHDLGNMNLCIMSDRQKGLLEALKDTAPMAEQRFCVRHLYGNFRGKYGGGMVLKELLWECARATTKADFDDGMRRLREKSAEGADWLVEIGVHMWSKHAFRHFSKSDMLLNNICESWNKYILEARDKPLLTCLEWIRRSLMRRFVKKTEGMLKLQGRLTPKAAKRLECSKNIGQERCTLWCGGSNRFEVVHEETTYVVDMNRRSCSCNKWELTGIPCPHASSVILSTRGNVLEDFVDNFYSKEMYLKAYGALIEAMPGRREWEKSERPPPAPPIVKIQPGRPRKARKKEEGEKQQNKRIRVLTTEKYKCSNCGVAGHTKKTCNYPPRPQRRPSVVSRGGRPRNPSTIDVSGNTGRRKKKAVHVTNPECAGTSATPQRTSESAYMESEGSIPNPAHASQEYQNAPARDVGDLQPIEETGALQPNQVQEREVTNKEYENVIGEPQHTEQQEREANVKDSDYMTVYLWDPTTEIIEDEPYRWEDAPVTGSIPQSPEQWKWGRKETPIEVRGETLEITGKHKSPSKASSSKRKEKTGTHKVPTGPVKRSNRALSMPTPKLKKKIWKP